MKKYLVLIRQAGSSKKFEYYVEVSAHDEHDARRVGWSTYFHMWQYVPAVSKLMEKSGVTLNDLVVPEAIEI